MHILFLSCIQATGLIEKKLNLKLSFGEKLQLNAHKMMCKACTRYEKHSIIIEKGIENYQKNFQPKIDIKQFKKQISEKIKNPEK